MKLSDLLRVRIDRTGADIGAVVHLETGSCLELAAGSGAADSDIERARTALVAHDAAQTARLARTIGLAIGEDIASTGTPVDEVIVTGKSARYEVSQTIAAKPAEPGRENIALLMYLRFDANSANLALARHRVSQLATDVELESADYLRIQRITEKAREAIEAERSDTPAPAPPLTPAPTPAVPAPNTAPRPAPPGEGTSRVVLAPVGSVNPPQAKPAPVEPGKTTTGSGRDTERDEYRHMSEEAIRWLKNFKRLTEWTRGKTSSGEPNNG